MTRVWLWALLVVTTSALSVGCAGSRGDDPDSVGQRSLSDADRIVRNADGTFTVTCADGRVEQSVSADAIRADRICVPSVESNVFSDASCQGSPWDAAELVRRAGLDPAKGIVSAQIGSYALHGRQRDCFTAGSCTDWREGFDDVEVRMTGTKADTGSPCPFANRAPVLCGPGRTSTRVANTRFFPSPENQASLFAGDLRLELESDRPVIVFGDKAQNSWSSVAWKSVDAIDAAPEAGLVPSDPRQRGYDWRRAFMGVHNTNVALAWTAQAAGHCVRYAGAAEWEKKDERGNSFVRRAEIVLFGSID